MPQGGGTRLGGEFQAGDFSVRGRHLFLDAFARLHPEAVKTLRQLAKGRDNDDAIDGFCEKYYLWCIPLEQCLNPTEQTLPDWLRVGVRDTVGVWRSSAWARKQAEWFIRRLPTTPDDELTGAGAPVEPETDWLYRLSQSVTWEPAEKTESEFRADIEEYIKHRTQEYTRDGMQLAPIRRDVTNPYTWAVLFHVDRTTFRKIAENANRDINAVREAVNSVRSEIGLPSPKVGRRRR